MRMHLTNNYLISEITGFKSNNIIFIILWGFIGSVLLTISSKLQIPLAPVPVTFQTLVVLIMSMMIGWRAAGFATVLYIFEGTVLGLPVFASGGGLAYLMGPTGGFLIGFVFASIIMGFLSEIGWDKSIILTFITMLLGTLVIYFFGILWFSNLFGFNSAITLAVIPFIYFDFLKICLGTLVISAFWEVRIFLK